MKLQVAAALCVLLLVASDLDVVVSQAAQCSILQLASCEDAGKDAKVVPAPSCCGSIRRMGQGKTGADCLCSLVDSPLARDRGVIIPIALSIPNRCNLPVPRFYTCRGMRVPGGW